MLFDMPDKRGVKRSVPRYRGRNLLLSVPFASLAMGASISQHWLESGHEMPNNLCLQLKNTFPGLWKLNSWLIL